jgi:hypothetical protein
MKLKENSTAMQCSPHQLKKGAPPLFPAEKGISAPLLKFFLENDPQVILSTSKQTLQNNSICHKNASNQTAIVEEKKLFCR